MEGGPVPEVAVCRICERSVPASQLLEHSDVCRVLQNCSESLQRSNDHLASTITYIDVRLRRSVAAIEASLGTQPPVPTTSPPPSSVTAAQPTALGIGADEGLAQAFSVPSGAAHGPGSSLAVSAASLDEVLSSIGVCAREALRWDTVDDVTAAAPQVMAKCDQLTHRALELHVLSGDEQLLRHSLKVLRQAASAKEEALAGIQRCQQHPSIAGVLTQTVPPPRIEDFVICRTLSRGSFGEVLLARKKSTNDYFAIKVMKKDDLMRKNQLRHVLTERKLMARINSPYVVKLYYSFQTVDSLYMVMEYANGGDVASLLRSMGVLTESWARFYAAELVQALDNIHSIGIVHRDIKPDNLLITANGHLKLADFGLSSDGIDRCRIMPHHVSVQARNVQQAAALAGHFNDMNISEERHKQLLEHHNQNGRTLFSLVGAPDYVAPEVIQQSGHDTAIDWWTLGVCLYQFLVGYPPFFDTSVEVGGVFKGRRRLALLHGQIAKLCACTYPRTRQHDADVGHQAGILRYEIEWSWAGKRELHNRHTDLGRSDRQLDPNRRLGARGADEVRAHPFFQGIDWYNLHRTAPDYVPVLLSPTDDWDSDDERYPSLGSVMQASLHEPAASASQEDLLMDPEQLAQFPFKNISLLDDVNRSVVGHVEVSASTLPATSVIEDVMATEVRRSSREEIKLSESIHCLVAEDNPVMQLLVEGLMRQIGVSITQAYTGTETVRHANRTRFDIIFMDIMMPEMDGTEATRLIRSQEQSQNRDTPIIAFTALGDANQAEYLNIGMNDILVKPFTRAELFALFKKWLSRRTS